MSRLLRSEAVRKGRYLIHLPNLDGQQIPFQIFYCEHVRFMSYFLNSGIVGEFSTYLGSSTGLVGMVVCSVASISGSSSLGPSGAEPGQIVSRMVPSSPATWRK
jgi:hypothetical protein